MLDPASSLLIDTYRALHGASETIVQCVWGARLMWGVLGVALCTTPNKQ
jgi:hypothetical protein